MRFLCESRRLKNVLLMLKEVSIGYSINFVPESMKTSFLLTYGLMRLEFDKYGTYYKNYGPNSVLWSKIVNTFFTLTVSAQLVDLSSKIVSKFFGNFSSSSNFCCN